MGTANFLSILDGGVRRWNRWRKLNPAAQPDLNGANLSGRALSGVDFSRVKLVTANLSGARLRGANLRQAELIGANLSGCDLYAADLSGANISKANFIDSFLTRATLLGTTARGSLIAGAQLIEADLTGADFSGGQFPKANLSRANLTNTDLRGADLESAILVETGLKNTNLQNCRIHGASIWGLRGEPSNQSGLVITPRGQAAVRVDNLEVAQFIYLLLNRSKLRDVIQTMANTAVLILGRFTGRMQFLGRLAQELRQRGYLPVIFDFERPLDRDFTETVKVLAGLSIFVIADITNPSSIPQELQATVPDYSLPFIPLLRVGHRPYAMFIDLQNKYDWVLEPVRYIDAESLVSKFDREVIEPALAMRERLRRKRSQASRAR